MNDVDRKQVLADMRRRIKVNTEADGVQGKRTLKEITAHVDVVSVFLEDMIAETEKHGSFKKDYGFSNMDTVEYWNDLFHMYGIDVSIPTGNKSQCANMVNAIGNSFDSVHGNSIGFGFREDPKGHDAGFYAKFYSNKPVREK